MNKEPSSHITLIRAYCQAVIEQAKLATAGPWESPLRDLGDYFFEHTFEGYPPLGESGPVFAASNKEDALFIATSRQFTPAAAEAVLVALDALCAIAFIDKLFMQRNESFLGCKAFDALQSLADKFAYLWK